MKRYFKPVEKDGNAKKSARFPAVDTGIFSETESEVTHYSRKSGPLKFITWNANGLLHRVKNNWQEFSKFISSIDPDVIAIQEVRMPAASLKGTCRNPGDFKDDTSSSREEKQILLRTLSSSPFLDYFQWWSLGDSKYAGTGLLVKKSCPPRKVSFSLDKTASKHEPDGRVILAEFKEFYFLNTYVPNNGWKEEENSFHRRRKWDKRMLDFVTELSDKPLIWCGDLNVSHEAADVSHPEFFRNAKLNGYTPPNEEDCGQPGFTLNERRRFTSILKCGNLIDAYRYLHKDTEGGFSWCGNPIGKYRGKRMRIDYFILSEALKDRILSCQTHGQGIEMQGFFGSDHCPVSLELLPINEEEKDSCSSMSIS